MSRKRLEKKQESTYAFRISKKEKETLENKVERMRSNFNSKDTNKLYKVTKNEVIIAALQIGLDQLDAKDLPKRKKKDV